MTQDPKYIITALESSNENRPHELKQFQWHFETEKYLSINKSKCYSPEISFILTTKRLAVYNQASKQNENINGTDFIETYEKAFEDGVNEFNKNYGITPNTLYGDNAKFYVQDLHMNYAHKLIDGIYDGWRFVQASYPIMINHQIINKYGFYAGMVSSLSEIINSYPILFKTFEECQHEPMEQISNKQKNHLDFDPNLWNNHCYGLFKYLYENYYKGTKRQLTNIWFYLRYHAPKEYTFNATKDQYEDFISRCYGIDITNWDKAPTKFEEKDCPTMNDHRINYEDSLK